MPRPRPPGDYADAAEVLKAWAATQSDRHPSGTPRERLAKAAGVKLGAVGHWFTGHSFPREKAKRVAIRPLLGRFARDYEWRIAEALGLDMALNLDENEHEVVAAMRRDRHQLQPEILDLVHRHQTMHARKR